MDELIHGSLVALTDRNMGDQIDTAVSAGAQTISVDDATDYDEDGGLVQINGVVYTYDSADLAADTIHLTTGLTGSAAVGDWVYLWDGDNNVVVSERVALVSVDDQDGDPIQAAIDYSLTPILAQGTLASGQSVTIAADDDDWVLTKVHGKNNQALTRSTTGFLQYGADNYDGTVMGIEIDTSVSPMVVRLVADPGGGVKVQQSDRSTYLNIRAAGFLVSSDRKLKTGITDAPDALAIVSDAPASHWRYLTDSDDVLRLGPFADDLPDWAVEVDTDGTRGVDQARMVGILWRAVEQLQARITELEKGSA